MRDVFTQPSITVIIPVLNERDALPQVLAALPWNILSEVIVVDNGSTDGTGEIARQSGARVVYQPQQGYGAACLAVQVVIPRHSGSHRATPSKNAAPA